MNIKSRGLVFTIGAALSIACGSTMASEVSIPNTFVADTPAKAEDVNANFTAIKNAVDDNNANTVSNTTAIGNASSGLTKGVNDNAAAIGNNSSAIGANSAAISANTAAIGDASSGLTKATNDNAAGISTLDNAINAPSTGLDARTTALESSHSCPGDMVQIGQTCVDKYEASVWDAIDGGSSANSSACSENGSDCKDVIYAQSRVGVLPAVSFTWFQAQVACHNSGKRLITNAEWQIAALGTVDPGTTGDGVSACNISSGAAVNTGSAGSNCASAWGVYDMIGNVQEFTADWMAGTGTATNIGSNTALYGNDGAIRLLPAVNQGNGANFPAAIIRGGRFDLGASAGVFYVETNVSPSGSYNNTGFRCAMDL